MTSRVSRGASPRPRPAARRSRARSPIGAHVPTRGGLARGGLAYAERVGAEAVQVFLSNPRGWAPTAGDPAQEDEFRARCAERGIPVFVHAPYLVNLGSPSAETLTRSVESLRHSLLRGARIGAAGVVVHAGSAVARERHDTAMRQVREQLLPLLDAVPAGGPRLLVEPTAGGGGALAARVGDLGPYLDTVDRHPALGVCIDTCHLHAAGHDIATAAGMRTTLTAVARTVGRERIGLIHLNDTAQPLGSCLDRHAAIGSGLIGADAFAALFTHPATRGVPGVVETAEAGHAADIAALVAIRDGDDGSTS